MGLLGGAQLVSIGRARADHKVISADPLEVVSILNSRVERYTPIADFYVRNHYRSPSAPAENFLTIEGEVEKPRRLALADLSRVEKRGFGAVLECAGNPVSTAGLVSNGLWEDLRCLTFCRWLVRRARPHTFTCSGAMDTAEACRSNAPGRTAFWSRA